MIFAATAEQAHDARRWWDGTFLGMDGTWIHDYFGRTLAGAVAEAPLDRSRRWPQAYFVEGLPGSVLPPHFHLVDQFQVFLGGAGRIGKEALEGFGIHYANAYTSYGPIAAGPAGLNYFTLRNCWDRTLAHRMPQARAELKPEPRRHLVLRPPLPLDAAALAALRVPEVTALHGPEADGLGAWIHRLPAGAVAHGPDPAGGAGQYWVVLGGSLLHAGGPLPAGSCLFQSEEEAPLAVAAGPGGLEVLTVQFPVRVPRRL